MTKQEMETMRKTMSDFGASAKTGADYAEKMQSIDGFPVASSSTVDAGVLKMTTSSEVTVLENPMLKSMQQRERQFMHAIKRRPSIATLALLAARHHCHGRKQCYGGERRSPLASVHGLAFALLHGF